MERTPAVPESPPLSPEKAELLDFEKEGKYLFHGTGADVEILEPRQAIDTKRGKDGAPGVFASNKAEYAIFMAIVNKYNCPHGSHSRAGTRRHDDEPPILNFGMSKETAEQLQDSAAGWVYVFDKNDFVPHQTKEGVEFVSHTPVRPVRKVRVSKRDLPEKIEVFEEE